MTSPKSSFQFPVLSDYQTSSHAMPKNKSRAPQTSDTKEARLVAAQSFIKGDRVRHKITGKIGEFDSINLGFALPEIWVQFETDTEFRVPISCNPLELELIERGNDSTQFSVATVESTACAIEQLEKPDEITENKSPSSLSCMPFDQKRQRAGGFLTGELPPTPAYEALWNTGRAPHPNQEYLGAPIQVGYQEPDVLAPARELPSPLPLDDERSSPDTTHTSLGITISETSVQFEESSMSSAVGLHARESVEHLPTKEDEIWSAPASGNIWSDSSTTADIPDACTNIAKPDGGQLTLPLVTSVSTNVVSPTAQSDLYPKETPFHPNNQPSCGDESDISPDGFRPGMRVWSERTITHKGKPNQVIRMDGVVVRTTSRLIVSDQSSNAPIDTPLVEVQWDGTGLSLQFCFHPVNCTWNHRPTKLRLTSRNTATKMQLSQRW